ncbi:MAG: nucleotide sugar dehydrogenase [Cyanobacteria bacterium]|nr:nucleotide sugar dehydrogenase [Cyanobacteriota bacterium]
MEKTIVTSAPLSPSTASTAAVSSSTSQDNQIKDALLEKIKVGTAKVVVIGLGYVGLPLSLCVAKVGFKVLGIDVSPQRVSQLNQGVSYIDDVTSEELLPFVTSGQIRAFDHYEILPEADIIIICVPTPLTKNRDPDISYIRQSTEEIAKRLRPGQLITLESTTYPGTTEEVMRPILERTGLKVGKDFYLAFSPERVDPGNARYTTHNTNKVLGGSTPNCNEVAAAFYRKTILDIITVSSPGCAEMVKVFENTFRAVNIALVNELALLCDKMGINVWEVVEAAGTKPFGILSFYPGPGVGGHCIPIDPFYLTWKAREYNFHTRFIELAGEINSFMPEFVREKLMRALGHRGKPLYGSKVLILGVAYKKDLRDWRHSPGIDLVHVLQKDGVNILFSDPHVPKIEDNMGKVYRSSELTAELLESVDCTVIITDHSDFDFDFIVTHSPVVVDTRNACRNVLDQREKIVLL